MKSQSEVLQDILHRIEQIERFTLAGETAFLEDDRTQEAVIRCFEVIGEAVKRLEPSLISKYPSLAWRSYAGFRDILIHQYDNILIPKVWESVSNDIQPLKIAVDSLLLELDKPQTE